MNGVLREIRKRRGEESFRRGLGAEFLCRLVLRLKFYSIMGSRVKTPLGEIDIVAGRGRTLAFIEVKARPDIARGAEAVSEEKQTRIVRAAQAYLSARPRLAGLHARFDLMLVAPGKWPVHIVNAFEAPFYPQ